MRCQREAYWEERFKAILIMSNWSKPYFFLFLIRLESDSWAIQVDAYL